MPKAGEGVQLDVGYSTYCTYFTPYKTWNDNY